MKENRYFHLEEIKRKMENYCVYQERCHKEIEKKMTEFTLVEEAKNKILLHLLAHNFLNEERFSRSFARGKFNIKKWGKKRIVRELKLREVSEYNIKSALKEIDEDLYLKTINEIAIKKNQLINEPNFYKRKKKLVDFLIRKGYEYDLIFTTVENILT